MNFEKETKKYLVGELGHVVEANFNTLVCPWQPPALSAAIIMARQITSGSSLLRETAQVYHLEVGGWHDTLDAITARSNEEGIPADCISRVTTVTKRMDAELARQGCSTTALKNSGAGLREVFRQMVRTVRMAKQIAPKFPLAPASR